MSKRSYRIIFSLLLSAVLALLFFQAYFLKQFYEQKHWELNNTAYRALDDIGAQLKKQETYSFVQESIEINANPPAVPVLKLPKKEAFPQLPLKREQRKIIVDLSDSVRMCVTDTVLVEPKSAKHKMAQLAIGSPTNAVFTVITNHSKEEILIENLDSAQHVLNLKRSEHEHASKTKVKQEEILKLLNRVNTEIRVADSVVYSADTVSRIIARSFKNKGITLPFEFAIEKREDGTSQLLSHSKNFDKAKVDFEYNLSINNVLVNYRYLLLHLPDIGASVLASMKMMIALSLALSSFVLLAFFFSLRLIAKQRQLSELRNDFINNMTHELKTPIATVSLALSALENEQVKKDVEKSELYHRILREENEKMNKHVERVLQLSLLEKGKIEINFERCEVSAIAQKALSNFKLKAESCGSELKLITENKTLEIMGDATQLELALNALLDNALKYGGAGQPITVEVLAHDNFAFVCITDKGIGIVPAKQTQIFERFYRVQGGDIHDVKGFGLGLSFVKQIIELHKGSVSCESAIGKGSTFIVKLPLYA